MSYRNSDGPATSVIITIPIIIGLYTVPYIKRKLFLEMNDFLFWILFLLSISLIIGLIYLKTAILNKIKKRKERLLLQNTFCEHGVKGGKTLMLCNQCLEIKKREQQKYEEQKQEQVRKDSIKQRVLELRNIEIARFTKVSLVSKNFLYNITPNEFEDVIAEMYKKLGYDVKQTPYSNDKGKDIILKKDGKKYLVECKRYNFENTIGREALQKFFAAIIEEKAEKGFFITTSDYKSTAIQYAKDIEKIDLINGNELVLMMRKIYPENYDSNLVKIMCPECGDIVEFIFKNNELQKFCKNGHIVENDFDNEILSPKYVTSNKYCEKCGRPMKLVTSKGKRFWGCSDYPRCRSYQNLKKHILY